MNDITLTHTQRRILIALIAGQSISQHAEDIGKRDKAVQKDLQRARDANGLTSYQLVAKVAADMVRAGMGLG